MSRSERYGERYGHLKILVIYSNSLLFINIYINKDPILRMFLVFVKKNY